MTVIGYVRVSTIDQDLSVQKATLQAAGCNVIRTEKRSGATTASRKKLRAIVESLHDGDVLMVTRIDKLARSIGDLQDIVRAIYAKGASLKATEQPIDTSITAGKVFLDMLGVFAEFETNLRKERQHEGIAKARAEGRYKGRPNSIDVSKVRELKAQGKGATEIAREMKIARASVYRALQEQREMSLLQPGSRGRIVKLLGTSAEARSGLRGVRGRTPEVGASDGCGEDHAGGHNEWSEASQGNDKGIAVIFGGLAAAVQSVEPASTAGPQNRTSTNCLVPSMRQHSSAIRISR
jgi:DNA invertase Pin-like site-specific DNA recombinase